MTSVAITVFLFAMLFGFCFGGVIGLGIYYQNKKNIMKKPKKYSNKDRKQLVADNEILLSRKEEHSANQFN